MALFVGTFLYPPNREVLDLLRYEIWPLVRQHVPDARLLLPDPETATCVPIYLHDFFGNGRHGKVVSIKSAHLRQDFLKYQEMFPLTGAEAHVEEFPRDALVFVALLGAYGLYAFSGRPDQMLCGACWRARP